MVKQIGQLALVLFFLIAASFGAASCSVGATATGNNVTSGGINTTGATLMLTGTSGLTNPTLVKDSQGNSWSYLSSWGTGKGGAVSATIGWVDNPISTSSLHTITTLTAPSLFQSAVFTYCTGTSPYMPTVNTGTTTASDSTTLTWPSFRANAGDVMVLTAGTNGKPFTVSASPSCLGVTFITAGTAGGGWNEGAALFIGIAATTGTCRASATFSANTDWVGAVSVFLPSPVGSTEAATAVPNNSKIGPIATVAVGAQVGIDGGYAESCTPANITTGAQLMNQGQIVFTDNGMMIWDDVTNNDVRVYNTSISNITAFGQTIKAGCTALIAGQANLAIGYNYSSIPMFGTSAQLAHPAGLGIDSSNNVYIADQQNNNVVELRYSDGMLFTVAGSGPGTDGNCTNGSYAGDGGPATSAKLYCPQAVFWVANNGNPYLVLADGGGNRRIRAVNLGRTEQYIFNQSILPGNIQTVAGNGKASCATSGTAISVAIPNPNAVAVDQGILYVAPASNCPYFLQVNSAGMLSVFAGTGSQGYLPEATTSAPCTSFPFYQPFDIKFDSNHVAYLTDQLGATITMAKNGTCSYIVGNPNFYGNRGGYGPVNGPARYTALEGAFNPGAFGPIGATPDNHGYLWINDSGANRILKVDVACYGGCAP